MWKDLVNRGKCAVGMHEGEWAFVGPDTCTQRRVCSLCGDVGTRAAHQWGDWTEDDGCLLVRRCSRCGDTETAENHAFDAWSYLRPGDCTQQVTCTRCGAPGPETRTAHDWSSWFYSEANRAPVRVCPRCSAMASPFAYQEKLVEVAAPEPTKRADAPLSDADAIRDTQALRPTTGEQLRAGDATTASLPAGDAPMTPEMDDDEALVALFAGNDVAAQRAFLEQCPPAPMKEAALDALGGSPEVALMALNMVADTYSRGAAPALGQAMGGAVYRLARQAYGETGSVMDAVNAQRGAVNRLRALASVGRHDEVLRFGRSVAAWLATVEEVAPEDSMQAEIALLRVESLLALGQYDAAQAALDEVESRPEWDQLLQNKPADRQRVRGLRKKIEEAKQAATRLPEAETRSEREQIIDARHEMVESVRSLQEIADPGLADLIEQFTGGLMEEVEADVPDSLGEWALRNQAMMDRLSDFIGGSGGEMNQLQNQKRIRNASLIFADPEKGRDPQTIEQSRAVLEEALVWSQEHGFIEEVNSALWGLYLCHSRMERPRQAIEMLQALRSNIEEMRSQVADPQERAGLLARYPYLFPALCYYLNEVGDTAGLLEAMEGAKGRVLADVLTRRRGEAMPDRPFAASAGEVPAMMQAVSATYGRSHYLSFFVDEEESYAVLVAADGSLHAHTIPAGKETVREWAKERDPKGWQVAASAWFGGAAREPLDRRLAPLVAWLEPLFDEGLLAEGDHVCYCPDAELHLIPLHYVTFRGQPLVRTFSLSRIHSARALALLLEADPAPATGTLAVQVPAQEDVQQAEKVAAFGRAAEWLAEARGGRRLDAAEADRERLAQTPLAESVVHFATHGLFPERAERNPFYHSGLVLAAEGRLPLLDDVNKGRADAWLLTPERALDLDFGGSHVTLQACVSGLAKEGIGGDALGLEWALLQAGAQSVLASHWHVPAGATADFSVDFYRRWFLEGASRAGAWRGAMQKLMDVDWPADYPAMYYWAGFSLSGDWR